MEGADSETDTARQEESPSVTASASDPSRNSRAVEPRPVQSGVPGAAGAVSSPHINWLLNINFMWEQIGTKFAQKTNLNEPTSLQQRYHSKTEIK